jgi:hypothetical protein
LQSRKKISHPNFLPFQNQKTAILVPNFEGRGKRRTALKAPKPFPRFEAKGKFGRLHSRRCNAHETYFY